jgi:hypothetical protein
MALPVRCHRVRTFIVNQDGIVYQEDLGPQTAALAKATARYNPDASWRQVPPADPAGCREPQRSRCLARMTELWQFA